MHKHAIKKKREVNSYHHALICTAFALPLSSDSLCTFPRGPPEEQVSVRLRHHQHAHGLRQGRAKDEGASAASFVNAQNTRRHDFTHATDLCSCNLLQDLMERLDGLLCGEGSESLKSLCLKLLLCLVTVRKCMCFACPIKNSSRR